MPDLEPPDWFDQTPPPSAPANAGKGAQQRRPPNGRQAPQATAEDVGDFYAWLDNPRTALELRKVIPSYLDVDLFLATCKEAALSNARLLAPNLRPSLLRAVAKAARQGLRPDGKEGALVPRYDAQSKSYGVVWQPMIAGVHKLGRLTGAIKTIRGVIVYEGEYFEMEEGDEPRWVHRVDRDLVDQAYQSLYGGMTNTDRPQLVVHAEDYFRQVSCAYCIITATDGTVTKRWMSARRIHLIRQQQGHNTPWYGPYLDEMILKTVMHYTAKWIDLDISNPATRAFREALLDDVGGDLEALAPPAAPQAMAIGHETKLHAFETLFAKPKETADLEKSPLAERLEQAMAAARDARDIEAISSEDWFRDGLAALREQGAEAVAEEMVGHLVRKAEELGDG